MIRYHLFSWLNRHISVQYALLVLPVFSILVYVYSYVGDLSSVMRVIVHNDEIVEEAYSTNKLVEITDFTEDGGTVSAVVTGGYTGDLTVIEGDLLFTVQVSSADWYTFILSNGDVFYQTGVDFIDELSCDEDGTISVSHDGKTVGVEEDSVLCNVYLDESGSYLVDFEPEGLYDYTLDTLSMLTVSTKLKDGYHLLVKSSFSRELTSVDVSFCSNLPSNNLYYDESSDSFVRNISGDFTKTFILGSNIIIVMLSALLYIAILYRVSSVYNLELIEAMKRRTEFVLVYIVLYCSLLVCIIITLLCL